MECEQTVCKLDYEACFTFACNMFKGMDLDRDYCEMLASDWWWGNIWCWQKCDYSWHGTLLCYLETWKDYPYRHCLVMCNSLQTVVTTFWDGAFRIITWHSWTVPHASTTAGKYQPLFSSKMECCHVVCYKSVFVWKIHSTTTQGLALDPVLCLRIKPNLMPPDFIVWNSLRRVLIFSSPHVLLT